jgi:hypothetical protein
VPDALHMRHPLNAYHAGAITHTGHLARERLRFSNAKICWLKESLGRPPRKPDKQFILSLFLLLKLGVFFTEPFNAAGSVHQFLLTGKKGVAFGANLNTNSFFCGSHLDFVSTGAFNGCVKIFGMNVGFHF